MLVDNRGARAEIVSPQIPSNPILASLAQLVPAHTVALIPDAALGLPLATAGTRHLRPEL